MKFLEIAPAGRHGSTKLRDQEVDIQGLSARQIANVLVQHEDIQKLIEGKKELNTVALVQLAPRAVAAWIAYGTGYEDDPVYGGNKEQFDKAVHQAMGALALNEQVDLVLAISDLTFAEHLNPFVKALVNKVTGAATGDTARPGRPPDIRSLSPTSLKEWRDSLRSATTPEMFGNTRQDKSAAS